jgi:hypothetical protein
MHLRAHSPQTLDMWHQTTHVRQKKQGMIKYRWNAFLSLYLYFFYIYITITQIAQKIIYSLMYQRIQQAQMVNFAEIVASIALVLLIFSIGSGFTLLLVRKYPKLGSSIPALGAIANIAQSGIDQVLSSNRRGDQGSASLNTSYPDVKSWFSKSTDTEDVVIPGGAPTTSSTTAPSSAAVAPLGAKAPTVSEAYGFANPISAMSQSDPPMAADEQDAGTRASNEYDAANAANVLMARDGSDGRGTDNEGIIGADLGEVYGNLMITGDADAVAKAQADEDNDPIKGMLNYDGPYDDDATLLSDAYGSAFVPDNSVSADGTATSDAAPPTAPALTPQGIVNGMSNIPDDLQVKVTQNPKNIDILRGPPQRRDQGLRRSEEELGGEGPQDMYIPPGGAARQRMGAMGDDANWIPSGGRALVRTGAPTKASYYSQSIEAY